MCRGQYSGSEEERLAVLGLAQDMGAPYVDVELKAAPAFSASRGVSGIALWRCQHVYPSKWLSFHGSIMALCFVI